ncbi:hypothetical protein PF008_g2079 [Phytophthora fragariae]|uniref:RxLR effector protein n=1 Tax=Phytophthora fragariae TaxID=53985 RepID=A0A6G0SI72_9STRA|nr:hypothetical protein PF008_g2079 [Phytophthora fragariae]
MCFFVIVLVWASLSCNSIRFKAATTGGTPTSAFNTELESNFEVGGASRYMVYF